MDQIEKVKFLFYVLVMHSLCSAVYYAKLLHQSPNSNCTKSFRII